MPDLALPTELCIKIVQLAADQDSHSDTRTRFLASIRLVSVTFNEIAQRELFRTIVVNSPQQLASLAAFYRDHRAGHSSLVEELKVGWDDHARAYGKRGGAKEFRKAIRRLCALCPNLRRVTIEGPETNAGTFFCVDWLEGAADTLEHLTLSRLSLASYPGVSDMRFPHLRSLSLVDCCPYARSQLGSFYSHFPHLVSLEIDNEPIVQALVEGALVGSPPPRFLSTLRLLSIPQSPFLRLFTPSRLVVSKDNDPLPRDSNDDDNDNSLPYPSQTIAHSSPSPSPSSSSAVSTRSTATFSSSKNPMPATPSSVPLHILGGQGSSSSSSSSDVVGLTLSVLTLTSVTFPIQLEIPFSNFVKTYATKGRQTTVDRVQLVRS